jgi:hypothetical protein
MSLTGKTIGQLTYLSGVTTDTLFPVELSGDTYHIAYSAFTNSNYNEGTYDELYSFATGETLTAGSYYLMTDFQTCYDQPNYDVNGAPITIGNYKTGTTEPILLLAISTTGFSPTVYSTLYPQDKISYDITWNATEVTDNPAKGRITERIDEFNNRTDYDHRQVVFKRYETSLSSGIYTVIKDNGNPYIDDIPTFGTGCYSNKIGNFYTTLDLNNTGFILSNNIFDDDCWDNTTGADFYNNTIGSLVYENKFGDLCHDNVIQGDAYNNVMNNNFSLNVIGSQFYNNSIFNGFRLNVIGSQFQGNEILSGFRENTTSDGFVKNRIGYDFTNPSIIIGTNFLDNQIGNNFSLNVAIGNSFTNNVIGDNFQTNSIADNFLNNQIKNYFLSNTTGNVFSSNNIGDNFNTNTIYFEFRKNSILNGFNLNTIGDVNNSGLLFENNQIMNNFKGNDIQGNFWSNQIKTDFKGNDIFEEFGFNNIGFGCSPNTFSGNTSHNNIGDYFSFNTCYGSFLYNTLGTDFRNNEIQDGFGFGGSYNQGNRIGNYFNDNTIGEYFYNNTIPDNFYNNTIGEYFQWNIVDTYVDNIDFTTNYGNISGITYFATGNTATDSSYGNVGGTTNGNGVNALFQIDVISGSVINVSVNNSGKLYVIGDTITILGTSIGGDTGIITTFSGNGIGITGVTGSYPNIFAQGTGSGENASFDVTVTSGVVSSVVLNQGGTGYLVGEILTISGDVFGSTEDITIIVESVYSDDVIITVTSISQNPSVYELYTCNIFKNSNLTNRLSYYDASDVLTIKNINE